MYVGNNQTSEPLVGDSQKNQLYQEQFYPNPESIYNHNSLNESVWESLSRDLTKIYLKLKVVAVPTSTEEKQKELKQWDLWGPFIICLLLGTILCFTSPKASGLVFSTVFIIMWIGSLIITMNSSLLGGSLSLMQCICLIGYCSFPAAVAALLVRVILSFIPGIGKLVIVLISFLWSSKASLSFIAYNIPEKKKVLAVYPVMLYFVYLNYYILV